MIRINSLNCVCYDKKMETPACWSELCNEDGTMQYVEQTKGN